MFPLNPSIGSEFNQDQFSVNLTLIREIECQLIEEYPLPVGFLDSLHLVSSAIQGEEREGLKKLFGILFHHSKACTAIADLIPRLVWFNFHLAERFEFSDGTSWTFLELATDQGALCLIQSLVEMANIDPNQPHPSGYSAISLAVRKNYLEIVSYFLKGVCTQQALTHALYAATQENKIDFFDLLTSHPSTNINEKVANGATALHVAAHYGYADILQRLISSPDIEINCVMDQRVTPLYLACCYEQVDSLNRLLKHPKIEINRTLANGVNSLFLPAIISEKR